MSIYPTYPTQLLSGPNNVNTALSANLTQFVVSVNTQYRNVATSAVSTNNIRFVRYPRFFAVGIRQKKLLAAVVLDATKSFAVYAVALLGLVNTILPVVIVIGPSASDTTPEVICPTITVGSNIKTTNNLFISHLSLFVLN
jgi:hypothetical protein